MGLLHTLSQNHSDMLGSGYPRPSTLVMGWAGATLVSSTPVMMGWGWAYPNPSTRVMSFAGVVPWPCTPAAGPDATGCCADDGLERAGSDVGSFARLEGRLPPPKALVGGPRDVMVARRESSSARRPWLGDVRRAFL